MLNRIFNKFLKKKSRASNTGYYDSDIYTQNAIKYKDVVNDGYILYGEIVGWTAGGAPLQKNYTYDVPKGESRMYVYRIAITNAKGQLVDLSWDAVKEYCETIGVETVKELTRMPHCYFVPDEFMDADFIELGYKNAVPLAKESKVDEGVVVRVDKLKPVLLKAKSPTFLRMETKLLDEDAVEPEEIESV